MEAINRDLQSNDTKTKNKAIDGFVAKLSKPSWLKEMQRDARLKLMNNAINTVKDANPKVAIAGLEATQLMILHYPDDFITMANMSFELLISRLGDAKVQIRTKACEVLSSLIGLNGLQTGFERITNHLTHRNQRVKESLLMVLAKLPEMYNHDDVRSTLHVAALCSSVAPLLGDQVAAVRQAAVEALGRLHLVIGDVLLDALGDHSAVKPSQLQSISEAAQSYNFQRLTAPAPGPSRNSKTLTFGSSSGLRKSLSAAMGPGSSSRCPAGSGAEPRPHIVIDGPENQLNATAGYLGQELGHGEKQGLGKGFNRGGVASPNDGVDRGNPWGMAKTAHIIEDGSTAGIGYSEVAPLRRRSVSASSHNRRGSLGSTTSTVRAGTGTGTGTGDVHGFRSRGGVGLGGTLPVDASVSSSFSASGHSQSSAGTGFGNGSRGSGASAAACSSNNSRRRSGIGGSAASTTGTHNGSLISGATGSGMLACSSSFSPDAFMPFVAGDGSVKPLVLQAPRSTDGGIKELARIMSSISGNLGKKDDWQARLSALTQMQALAKGNLGTECTHLMKPALAHLRNFHELICAQIVDLRSVVSKEACRAVAALARCLQQQLSPLVDLWLPSLMRLVVVKIQVISSAADRCIRVMVASFSSEPRLLQIVLETCTGKNPPLRKLALEYLALLCALWKVDFVERNIDKIVPALLNGVADSDPGARRTARLLFWVLRHRHTTCTISNHSRDHGQSHGQGQSQSQNPGEGLRARMDELLEGPLEHSGAARHVLAERDARSAELQDLLALVEQPERLLHEYAGAPGSCSGSFSSHSNAGTPRDPHSEGAATHSLAGHHAGSTEAFGLGTSGGVGLSGLDVSDLTGAADTNASALSGHARPAGLARPAGPAKGTGGQLLQSAGPPRMPSDDTHDISYNAHDISMQQEISQFDSSFFRDEEDNDDNAAHGVDDDDGATSSDTHGDTPLPSSSTSAAGIAPHGGASHTGGSRNDTTRSTAHRASLKPQPDNALSKDTSSSSLRRSIQLPGTTGVKDGGVGGAGALGGGARRLSLMSGAARRPSVQLKQQQGTTAAIGAATGAAKGALASTQGLRLSAAGGYGSGAAQSTSSSSNVSSVPSGSTGHAAVAGGQLTVGTQSVSALSNGPRRILRGDAAAKASATATITTTTTTTAVAANASSVPVRHAGAETADARLEEVSSKPAPLAAPLAGLTASASASSATGALQVFVFSAEVLRSMCADALWSKRLEALQHISARLMRTTSAAEGEAGGGADEALSLTQGMVEMFIDLAVRCMGDPHHKVAMEALHVVQLCVEHARLAVYVARGRLGVVAVALFQRLADRRAPVRDAANSILNSTRTTIDPIVIMAALSPKMFEIPDRMKTALMQYLGAVAPHCEAYFLQAQNSWSFLNRLAGILDSSSGGVGGGAKPSVTLTVAGRRLLELVYKTSPQVICSQIAALPLQQQITLKALLSPAVPDIDAQLTLASRAEWSSKMGGGVDALSVPPSGNHGHAAPSTATQHVPPPVMAAPQPTHAGGLNANVTPAAPLATAASTSGSSHGSGSTAVAATVAVAVAAVPLPPPSLLTSPAHAPPTPPSPPPTSAAAVEAGTRGLGARSPMCPQSPSILSPSGYSAARIQLVDEYIKSTQKISPKPASVGNHIAPASPTSATSVTGNPLTLAGPVSPVAAAFDETIRARESAALNERQQAVAKANAKANTTKAALVEAGVADQVADAPAVTAAAGPQVGLDATGLDATQSQNPRTVSRSPSENISPNHNTGMSTRSSSVLSDYSSRPTPYYPNSPSPSSYIPHMAPTRTSPTTISPKNPSLQSNLVVKSSAFPAGRSNSSVPSSAVVAAVESSAPPAGGSSALSPVSATQPASLVSQIQAKAQAQAQPMDKVVWLLEALRPASALGTGDRVRATKELKSLAKQADESFWRRNYAQIVSVLLESFTPEANGLDRRYGRLTWTAVCSDIAEGNESSDSTKPDGDKLFLEGDLVGFEDLVLSAKSLLLLMRYRGKLMQNLLEVLVVKYCLAAVFCPPSLLHTFEQTLAEFARYNALRLVELLCPHCAAAGPSENSGSSSSGSSGSSATTTTGSTSGGGSLRNDANVRLMSMHVVTAATRFLTSPQLLQLLPVLSAAVLPAFSSKLADHRQAAVFLLVEAYLCVGEALFPFVEGLTVPQRKLLTIYIEKRMQQRSNGKNNNTPASAAATGHHHHAR